MKSRVPVLITWDVDPTGIEVEEKRRALSLASELIESYDIKSTFLFVSMVAEGLRKEVQALQGDGQEIGCHGWRHWDEEEYSKMPEALQREYLQKATKILEDVTGAPIKSFRGPRVKTSHTTQGILEELGYVADSTVCSQRIDFVSSNLVNIDWMLAPRSPYHPSRENAFTRGDRKIWCIPVSAIVAPFISSVLHTFGLRFMKRFFMFLYKESLRTGKPVVYLIHPFDFVQDTPGMVGDGLGNLQRVLTHGFSFRRRFYEMDDRKRFEMNRGLFSHMKSQPGVEFMTISDYVDFLETQ